MSAPRTVRLLDRDPVHAGPRTVEGYVIEQDIPAPRHRALKRVLAALQVGESIVHADSGTWTRRLFKDRKFTAKRIAPRQYRIWRIE